MILRPGAYDIRVCTHSAGLDILLKASRNTYSRPVLGLKRSVWNERIRGTTRTITAGVHRDYRTISESYKMRDEKETYVKLFSSKRTL
jgi:hypothetical protein